MISSTDTPITELQEAQSLAQQASAGLTPTPPAHDQLTWSIMEPKIRKMVSDWDTEVTETKKRRKVRKIEVDQESMYASGKMLADETLIAVRVIDENIRKEQPLFVQYLTQSRRLAIFDCTSAPGTKTENLEIAFTKGMSYSGFLRNIVKCIDGAQTHGWDSVEILYDEGKPLKCGVEHIGHENLMFSLDSKDIQSQEFILRGFDVTIVQLKRFIKKHGFDPHQTETIINDIQSRDSENPKNVRIYKYYTKIEGVVNVGWCALSKDNTSVGTMSDWLKKPLPLDLGRRNLQKKTIMVDSMVMVPDVMTGMPIATPIKQPKQVEEWVPETESHYPVKIFLYSESEEQCITEQKGRVFFDTPFQEAQIALLSLFVNGACRASNVYASADGPDSTGAPMKKLDMTLEHGSIYSGKLNFFHTDYPDPNLLRAADNLNVRKSQEMGQTASAVINRDDARKTAEELKQAKDDTSKLGTIPILFFSGFMREVLTIAWYIVQSQAVQNQVLLVPIVIQAPTGEQTFNDPSIIGQTYDIKPAGDSDVVRRAEKLERRFMLVPLIQPTSAYPTFLMDLITELLPEDAEKYNSILRQGMESQMQTMLALAQMLQEATTDDSGAILPQWQPFAAQLQQVFAMIPQQAGQPNGKPSSPTPGAAKQG